MIFLLEVNVKRLARVTRFYACATDIESEGASPPRQTSTPRVPPSQALCSHRGGWRRMEWGQGRNWAEIPTTKKAHTHTHTHTHTSPTSGFAGDAQKCQNLQLN